MGDGTGHAERFEPYNSMAFKRRAVSPTASLHNGSTNGTSTPLLASPILGFAATVPSLPIAIPPLSPISAGLGLASLNHSAFFSAVAGARATSPSTTTAAMPPTASASATGAPRGALGMVLSGGSASARAAQEATMRDDEELSARAGDSLGGMSLG
jgi:hypothetical protein